VGLAAFAAALAVMDVVICAQHLAMHRIGLLWSLEPRHRTDRDADVTTDLRFHPSEIALLMGLNMTIIALPGALTSRKGPAQ